MDTTLHIPWTNEALEELLQEIVKTGETSKVDFKSIWDISSGGQQAEFARDVQAIANSSDPAYRNHGFLILGAKPGELAHTPFAENQDKMQATVDQILREHLGPFVPTHVRQFGTANGKSWGVVVVPPSRSAPHIFVRDTAKYKRGDVWVRIGTTTSKAEPSDFGRFFRTHLEDYGREFREELRDLQREVEKLKMMGPVPVVTPGPAPQSEVSQPYIAPTSLVLPLNTLEIVHKGLKKKGDPVGSALAEEAAGLRTFLDSNEIPWDLNNLSKENGPALIDLINEKSSTLWRALAAVVENDDEQEYDTDIVDAMSVLAFDPHSPINTSFTDFGTNIRLYPLTMALYIVFTIGLRKKRIQLLKRVKGLTLSPKSYYEEPLPIGTGLLYVRSASEVFQTLRDDYPKQRWCDSIGSHIQRWIKTHLGSEIPALERNGHFFYIAEFVLSLMAATTENVQRPASGLFYFMSESNVIIRRYLTAERETLVEIFGDDLKVGLERFDQWGSRIASSRNCWGDGFQHGATQLVFPS